jgi:PAS domain S-box-containing protein
MSILINLGKSIIRGWRGYLLAVALVALATWLKHLAEPDIIPTDVPILYLLAIVPTAIFFGFGPSILVAVLSLLAYDYYFVPPYHEFSTNIMAVPILGIFLAVAILISYLASNLRRKNLIAEKEIAARKRSETELLKYQDSLEDLVKQRTAELEKANLALQQEIARCKQTEEALRDSQQRWATTLESIGDAVLATDAEGQVEFMNSVAERLTGWNLREAFGQPSGVVFHIINEKTRQKVDSPISRVLQEGAACGLANHTLLVRKDGTELPIDDSGAPIITPDEEITGVVLVFRDISDRKRAEEALQKYTHDLEEANRELESFSYSVSHDLRAPLRGIDGFSNALMEDYTDKLDEQAKDFLTRIRQSTQLMGRLIDDMLTLSRINRVEMHPDKVNLSEMVLSIAEELKRSQSDRAAEFTIPPNIIACGDRALLDALLRNLLENAWKFTGKSPVSKIEFGVLNQNEERIYYIRDNGVGFDMKYSDKLFKPFSRLHSQEEYPGTGIGLANVLRIVHRHGGRVWSEGEPGKGAAFFFTLGQKSL